MLMDIIIGLLNEHPELKQKLNPIGTDEQLNQALSAMLSFMHTGKVIYSITDTDTQELIQASIHKLIPLMKSDPHIEHTHVYTYAYEHLLIVYNKILYVLDSKDLYDSFANNSPAYPMNPLLLFCHAACYSNYMINEDPFDNKSFVLIYNKTLTLKLPGFPEISMEDWNLWQRRFMYIMGDLSHPQPGKDNDVQDFEEAIRDGNRRDLEIILNTRPNLRAVNIAYRDYRGWTFIHFAAYHDLDIITFLNNLGIDPNELTTDDRSSAFHIAARMKSEKVMAEILSHPHISRSRLDAAGHTPLYYAIRRRINWAITELLDANTPLSLYDIHAPDKRGYTLFHYAAAYNYPRIINLLINQLADPNSLSTRENRTPLHIAVIKRHLGIVRAILQQCASINLNIRDSAGKTAFDHWLDIPVLDRDPQIALLFNPANSNNVPPVMTRRF